MTQGPHSAEPARDGHDPSGGNCGDETGGDGATPRGPPARLLLRRRRGGGQPQGKGKYLFVGF